MPRRLANRPLVEADVRYAVEAGAKYAAKLALEKWYKRGFSHADSAIRKLQIESNLKIVKDIPQWQENTGDGNGYVMLDMWLSGAQRPVVVMLDYKQKACGGLTYRQLHSQIRMALELEPKVSMRLRRYRPWCRYMLKKCPFRNRALCQPSMRSARTCWARHCGATHMCEKGAEDSGARGAGTLDLSGPVADCTMNDRT